MAWRGVHLTQPCRLSLADGQIVVDRSDGAVRLPIEDIAWLVIDTPQVSLSTALIAACMEAGLAMITTDRSHMPSGLLLPFHRHHRQAEVAARQVAMSAPLKKRLWQTIVQAKIANQAAVLMESGQDAAPLLAMTRLVGSGDPDNTEARAARAYWPRLFTDFVREDGTDKRNALLNYGYAVMRATVARALVAVGLLPAFGVNHASLSNAFNLADDVIEPFRPFVDRAVHGLTGREPCAEPDTTVAERQRLASLPADTCLCAGETVSLLVAAERAADSLVRGIETGSAAVLSLPMLRR